ncbi:ubiquitin-related domain-containing protein [Phycomyces nitens]|nr:ubiquitin-related domain-containing protein [Phycomyces nitens]
MVEESQFIQNYLGALSSRSVRFGQDFNPRAILHLRLKRKPDSSAKIEPEPKVLKTTKDDDEENLQVTIKIVKPASQFVIARLSPDDTVATLKKRIYQQQSAYPVGRQRLLIRGKVLADNKKLSDYGVADATVIHLMLSAAPKTPVEDVPITGRFGVSLATEQTIDSPDFWSALEATVGSKVSAQDTPLIMDRLKRALA